jgi:PST family polysaccharide transporter
MAKNKDTRHVVSNISYLSALQVVNNIIPLIILPYLVHVLGLDVLGKLVFAQVIVSLFALLIDYGFGLSAPHDIATNKGDKEKLSEIFFTIISVKVVILLFSAIVLLILTLTYSRVAQDPTLFWVTFGMVIGQLITPAWYFQGIEQMKDYVKINVIVRFIFFIPIFFLVTNADDYLWVPALTTLGSLLTGMLVFHVAWKTGLSLKIPTLNGAVGKLKNSTQFFIARLSNDGLMAYISFAIGAYYGNVALGLYSIVEKVFRAVNSLIGPVLQSLYPYMSGSRNLAYYKKLFLIVVSLSMVCIGFGFVFADWFIELVFNISNNTLTKQIQVALIATLFAVINMMIGYPLLAAFGYSKEATSALMIAAGISFIYVTIIVTVRLDVIWIVSALILYEMLGALIRAYYIKRVNIFGENNASNYPSGR